LQIREERLNQKKKYIEGLIWIFALLACKSEKEREGKERKGK
jgi:hypothetical protein